MMLPMKIEFFLRFSTVPGQKLLISGNIAELGGTQGIQQAIAMEYHDHDHWKYTLVLSKETFQAHKEISYTYHFVDQNGAAVDDWSKGRVLSLKDDKHDLAILDTWIDMGDVENIYHTAPFYHIFDKVQSTHKKNYPQKGKIQFLVDSPLMPPHHLLAITGNTDALGNWNRDGHLLMKQNGSQWFIEVDSTLITGELEYKYILLDEKKELVKYEHGENRHLKFPFLETPEMILVSDGRTRFDFHFRGTGGAIPLFSLRTKKGLGVGEFTDIHALVDWAESSGIKMIQLLPVNDTTSTHSKLDSYPYAAISAYALHPLYGSIEEIAGKKHLSVIKEILASKPALNALEGVDYEAVMELKWEAYSLLYDAMSEDSFEEKGYSAFFAQNKHWLVPYAAYSYLRDKFGTPDAGKWGKYSHFNEQLIKELCAPGTKYFDAIALHFFIQYNLHRQLKAAHDYANKKGLILKGDIAIGVHRHGADPWTQPELYHLDKQAGAPPDDFAIKGQNWGFPTYNWETMKADGFGWWKSRFEQMSHYFDAFRIDHILGFFRIWSIPDHATDGIMGRFVPAIPVYRDEFERRGIFIDEHRFCQPYINDQVLWELANGVEDQAKHFFHHFGDGTYRFKEAFDTQKKIEAYFCQLDQDDTNCRLKDILLSLHSNVILWKDDNNAQAFHFRFNISHTLSFMHLDQTVQRDLLELYNDYYFHRQEHIWRKEAMEKLPSLKYCTDMLICGEDLGLVPACVPEVMSKLGFLSMEVQRMPKKSNVAFFDPASAPYLSVVTPSTHDMSTIREWWLENPAYTQRFYNEQLWQPGSAPQHASSQVVNAIVLQHLASPAMWSVFQLQDLMAMSEELRTEKPCSERINVPGDAKHYWRYRIPVYLEDLMDHDDFNEQLKYFISSNGR